MGTADEGCKPFCLRVLPLHSIEDRYGGITDVSPHLCFAACFLLRLFGFDHGVGHSLLVLCDAKAPHGKKWNDFKALENYLFIVSISLS